mmetsp:Transcript_7541/g.16105  ORF Transcript_7541/g.16105 Transcript_7541/m.16105 type:complete len:796 (+) Transcript_7541:1068-3455(+)
MQHAAVRGRALRRLPVGGLGGVGQLHQVRRPALPGARREDAAEPLRRALRQRRGQGDGEVRGLHRAVLLRLVGVDRDGAVLPGVRLPDAEPPAPAHALRLRPGERQLLPGRQEQPLQRQPGRHGDVPLQAVRGPVRPAGLRAVRVVRVVGALLRAALRAPAQGRHGVLLRRRPLRGRPDGDEGVREELLAARRLRLRRLGRLDPCGVRPGERAAAPAPERAARGLERRRGLHRRRQGDRAVLRREEQRPGESRPKGVRALGLDPLDEVLRRLRRRPADAGPPRRGPGGARREVLRRRPGGDRGLQRSPLQDRAHRLRPGGVAALERVRRRGHEVPRAQDRGGALGDRQPLQRLPPGGPALQPDRRLRRQRMDAVGRVRQDVQRRPDHAPARGPHEPPERRQEVPRGAHAGPRLQHAALLRRGLRRRRVDPVVGLQHHVRQRPGGPEARLPAAQERGRRGLPPAAQRGPALQPGGVPVRRLPLGRLVRVEQLQRPLRRRPAHARPPHRQGAAARVQALRGQGQGGDGAVQHPALPREGLHRRPVGRLDRLGGVLGLVRGRRDLARAQREGGGERLRRPRGRAVHGTQELQREDRVHAQHRLPVGGLVGLDRLLVAVRGHQAPRPRGSDPRRGQGPVLRGRDGPDLAVRDRVRRAGLQGAQHVPRPLQADHQQLRRRRAGRGERRRAGAGPARGAQLQPGRQAAGARHHRGPDHQAHDALPALPGGEERRRGAHLRRHQRAVRPAGCRGLRARGLQDGRRRPGQGARHQGVRHGRRRFRAVHGEGPRQGLRGLLRHK